MKKKSTQRAAAWVLAVGMALSTFAQPLAVYAEGTAITSQDVAISADADVTVTPDPTAESEQTPAPADNGDAGSTAAPETTPLPVTTPAEETAAPTPAVTEQTPAPAEDAADTDAADTTNPADEDTTPVTPEDLQSCIALLAGAELAVDTDSVEPEVYDETMALADDITQNEADTLQALVNAAVWQAEQDGQTNVTVEVPANQNYTGNLVIPDATITGTAANGTTINVKYAGKVITINMNGSTLTVPTDAAVGVAVFGDLTINNGTIQAADGCTATRGVQVQVGGALTLDSTTVKGFTYAGPGAGVYVKGTAAVRSDGLFDVVLNDNEEPETDENDNYKIKKLQRENGDAMDTRLTLCNGSAITDCTAGGSGAALYAHNAALVEITDTTFANNKADNYGGALYLGTGVQLSLDNTVAFTENHSEKDGGALYLANQYDLHVKADTVKVQVPVTLDGTRFTGNSSAANGGALAMDPAFDGFAGKKIVNAKFAGNSAARGGAITFNSFITDNTIEACTFEKNTAESGGAVYYPNVVTTDEIFEPTYYVTDSTFTGNSATKDSGSTGSGGAIVLGQYQKNNKVPGVETASLYVSDSTFTGNTATYNGGAIATMRENGSAVDAHLYLNLHHNTFTKNTTTQISNLNGGGAVYMGSYAGADFTANTFESNTTVRMGGAIYSNNDNDNEYEGRTVTFGSPDDTAQRNTFTGNHADSHGGAIYVAATSNTTVHFYKDNFEKNTTNSTGGAIYASGSTTREDDTLTLTGVTFTGNVAQQRASGGALYLYGSRYRIESCTFTNNSTEESYGGAIRADSLQNLNVTDTTFTGNTAGSSRNQDARGGAVVYSGGTYNFTNVKFEGNKANYGGALCGTWNAVSQVNLSHTTFTGNTAANSGGAIYYYNSTLDVADSVFEKNTASSGTGGAISLTYNNNVGDNNSRAVIHEGCRFTDNQAANGGAIYQVSNSTTYTDDNGDKQYYRNSLQILGTAEKPVVFTGNAATTGHGGALYANARTDLTVEYATMDGNTAAQYGGAFFQSSIGNKTQLSNCTITNNQAQYGGAVAFTGQLQYTTKDNVEVAYPEPSDIQVRDCTITGNTASQAGGALWTFSDLRGKSYLYKELIGTIGLTDTTLDNNTAATYGGGAYFSQNWEAAISGGSISNNTAPNGGAVYDYRSTVTVDDETAINNNTATTNGAAFYVYDNRSDSEVTAEARGTVLNLNTCTVSGNTAQKGSIVYGTKRASFAMAKTVTVNANQATGAVYAEKDVGTFTLPAAADLPGCYTAWRMDDTRKLTGAVENDNTAAHYYDLLGAAENVARLNGDAEYPTLQEALDAAQKRGEDVSIDLIADVNEKVTASTVNNAITLNLNGYTLTGKITLNNDKNANAFTLTDEEKADYKEGSTGGVFTGVEYGIEMGTGCSALNTLVLKGGTLKGFTQAVRGNNYASITLDGASVEGFSSYGIRVNDLSSITVNKGAFHGNKGYLFIAEGRDSTITINDGDFYENTNSTAPVAYLNYNNKLFVNGGKFHDNTATNMGGAFYLANQSNTVTISGGEFYNNTAKNAGGVLAANLYSTNVTISGGDFHDNTAGTNGGVFALSVNNGSNYSSTFTMTGGSIHDNTASGNGGAVWIGGAADGTAVATVSITGGEIKNNTAASGGAVYTVGKADVTIGGTDDTHGVVMNNTATTAASNLYLGGADSILRVQAGGLLYGGTVAGDVLFAQGGHAELGEVDSLYLDPLTDEEKVNLAWLKNQDTEGPAAVDEDAPAETSYTLAPTGSNPADFAARIGDVKYYSIAQALDAANAADAPENAESSQTTIYLLRDQTETLDVSTLKYNVALNLNGYTLTGRINIKADLNKAEKTFTLCDDAATSTDYASGSTGGVFTGPDYGIFINSQSQKDGHTTVRLAGTLTLTGFGRHAVWGGNWVNLAAEDVTFADNVNEDTNASGNDSAYGAAIRLASAVSLQLKDCTFTGNRGAYRGGAIYTNDDNRNTFTITGCTFTNNYAGTCGGAIHLRGYASTLRGNTFTNNSAGTETGGAVCLYIADNAAKADENGQYDVVVENNKFIGNSTSSNSGGALYVNSTAAAKWLLAGNTFTGNKTTNSSGGAVCNVTGTLVLGSGNLFEKNSAYGAGSALYMQSGKLESIYTDESEAPANGYDNIFRENIAGDGNYGGNNGAVCIGGNTQAELRYALFEKNDSPYGSSALWYAAGSSSYSNAHILLVDHCRFEGNTSYGSTLVAADDTSKKENDIILRNTDFVDNSGKNADSATIYIGYSNSVDFTDVTITGTKGGNRSLILYGGGTGNAADGYTGATQNLTRVTVSGNTESQYEPIYVYTANSGDTNNDTWQRRNIQTTGTWTDCVFENNASTTNNRGSAVYIYKTNVTMNNCRIANNSGYYAALYLGSTANPRGYGDQHPTVFNLTDCTITGNSGTYGAGLDIGRGDLDWLTVNVTGGTISNNTSTGSGAGVRVAYLSTLNMDGTTISGNHADGFGGGIYTIAYDTQDGESRTNLTNCTITGNSANYGGGIYVDRSITGASNTNDTWKKYLTQYGGEAITLSLTGGSVTENTAKTNGGGISTPPYGHDSRYVPITVRATGTAIENNRAQLGQDVFAYKSTPEVNLYLPCASEITGKADGRWLNENTGATLPDEAVVYAPIQRTYPLTLNVAKEEEDVAQIVETNETFDSLQLAMDRARELLAGGTYSALEVKLLKNTNSSTTVSSGTNVTLNLNGYAITGIGGTPALTIEESTVTITGTTNGENAKNTISGTATDGGALLLRNNADVTLENMTLANSRAANRGGAAYLTNGASLTLGEGAVIESSQAAKAGAVYIDDGTLTQKGGTITGCSNFSNSAVSSSGVGGAVWVQKGTYTLESGAVTNNKTQEYGVIYISSYGEFDMTGGEISGNASNGNGGAIFQQGGTMTLAGGKIINNTANYGGAIFQNGGTSLVRDVEISGNTARNNGGGWYMGNGTSLMRGGTIAENTAGQNGGGIYQAAGSLTVNGAVITKNSAPQGGGVAHNNGTFNFQGGGLYANTATEDGTGNDVYSMTTNGTVNLIAAAGMGNTKYNVWRDDYYPYEFTTGYHNTSDQIAAKGGAEGGKYLTATVPNVNNVKLTADYYGSDEIKIESNDMYVASLTITKQDSGNGSNDAYDKEDGVITAQDVLNGASVAGVESVTHSGKYYPTNYMEGTGKTETKEYLLVKYSDGRDDTLVRPDTPLDWTAGNDSNPNNRLLRSFSTAQYIAEMQVKSASQNAKLEGTTQRMWVRIKVPCESGEVTLQGASSQFNSAFSYYDPTEGCQILEGYQDKTLKKDEATGTASMGVQFYISVGGLHNGDTVQPTIETWFDNSSYQSYKTDCNENPECVSLPLDTMTISAKAAYNLALDNQSDLKYVGYFDLANKVEITEAQYTERKAAGDTNVIYGMVAGYGLSLRLRNTDNNGKRLRGIEVPEGDITFEVGLHGGLYFSGERVYNKDGTEVAINPILWAYKPNDNSYTGYDPSNNTPGVNMYWNDEDDTTKNTHYDPKIEYNVTATHSGGSWSVLQATQNDSYERGDGTTGSQSQLTFRVSGYQMNPIQSSGSGDYTFSTGYLQVIIPLNLENYAIGDGNGNYDGFLQADMHVVADKFRVDGVADHHGTQAKVTDNVNGYYNFTEDDEEILRSKYAYNETYYGDNYNNSDTLGINISKSGSGNGSFITKTTYWLGTDGKTVLNDSGKKELGSNVTGVGSQLYMTGDLYFNSEVVTPSNNKDYYLYDPQVDQQTEYYYLTGFDVLMKFDPDDMEPVPYTENGTEQRIYKMNQDDVTTKLKGITLLNLSDQGHSDWDTTGKLTQSYELTVLYAAKDEETQIGNGNTNKGWQYSEWSNGNTLDDSQPRWDDIPNTRDDGGTADMDNYSFNAKTIGSNDAQRSIEGLVYYNTLTELKAAGKTCVGVLYQVRNCCIRNGRSVSVGHRMQIGTDVKKIGRSYAITMDMRGWTTYRPFYRKPTDADGGWTRLVDETSNNVLTKRSELLYQGLIEATGQQAEAPKPQMLRGKDVSATEWNIGQPTVGKPDGVNAYQKTQYSNGYEVGGSHSGYKFGNTVLIATQNATVDIITTDVAQGNQRQTDYQLDAGQRTVSVKVTPDITLYSNVKKDLHIFDGTTETTINVSVDLPKDLTLQQGTLTFDYSDSDYNRSDLTWQQTYEYQGDDGNWYPFTFEENYEKDYQQRPTRLTLTTTITDVQKKLPTFAFKAGIGYPADQDKDITGENSETNSWYKNMVITAEIHSTYEADDVNAALGRTDSTSFTVRKNEDTVINKSAARSLVEMGDDLTYDLTYRLNSPMDALELCDVLPSDSKAFHGAYALQSVTVTVTPAEGGSTWNSASLTLRYGKSNDVIRDSKNALDYGQTIMKAASGTMIDSSNAVSTPAENGVTWQLNDPPIHTASGSSDLGSLYAKLTDLPASTVKLHVVLTPKQENADGSYQLLTDADGKMTQQADDSYSNFYFARNGQSYMTSPTAAVKVRSRSISGLVWLDQNQDGVYTTRMSGGENVSSDKTLSGITVTLQKKENGEYTSEIYNTLGNLVEPYITQADGRYTFENLPQGDYRVVFTDSEGHYKMQDGSEPVMPFGKLSLTKEDAEGNTSNKATGQYDDDKTTLTAGVTDKISLGNAELTGRDDRNNINAGFYYTELRLEKDWYNVPDAAAVEKAEVVFDLEAVQGDTVLASAAYTLTSDKVTGPAEKQTLFGTFLKETATREEDTAQSTVRWRTDSGLALQAKNADGLITYRLAGETVQAEKNAWVANTDFVQALTSAEISSGADSDNTTIATRLIAQNTARTYDLLIRKLSDVEDIELDGATFTATLQKDGLLDATVKIESKPAAIQQEDGIALTRYRLSNLSAGTYTLQETKAPTGYRKDPVKYKLTIIDTDENGEHILPTVTLWDDKDQLLYTGKLEASEGESSYNFTVTSDENREASAARAEMTGGSCLETLPETEQEQSNLPIRTQIDLNVTDSYLFSLPFTGGSGMNRRLLQGVGMMALAGAAFAATAIARKRRKRHG